MTPSISRWPSGTRGAASHAPLDEFQRQARDLYIPVGDIGFWQGAFRDPEDPRYSPARKVIEDHQPWTVELLYGDHEGGQRCITRFTMFPPGHMALRSDSSPDLRWFRVPEQTLEHRPA